eukprot:JP435847.1.p1 GENE.JP435847.1~~JP435847.1.p1  ORF type:complete len:389 (+),score=131.73 JP435847.1:47-1213(+)
MDCTLESQRIISVIENGIKKLSLLESITREVQSEDLSAMVGDEVTNVIAEQRALESRFEELITQRVALKALSNKVKTAENQQEINEIAEALRASTKLLCRNLQDNPNLSDNMVKIQTERSGAAKLLEQTIAEMQEANTFDVLKNKVQSEHERAESYRELQAQERELSSKVDRLRKDLANEKKEFDTEKKHLQETVAKLKDELSDMRTKSAIERKYQEKENRAARTCQQRNNSKSESDAKARLDELSLQMDRETLSHEQTVNYLQNKQTALASELEYWNTRYEEDVQAKRSELETLRTNRESDFQKLKDLEVRYKEDVSEREARQAEERRQAELRAIQQAEIERKVHAAIKIQSVMRMYLVKKELRQAAEKSRKKKKGKGKGKGKGKKK